MSRFGFAAKCFSTSGFVAFCLYFIVSYLKLGSTGGDGYIMVPISALIVGCLSWLAALLLFSLANTHPTYLAACSGVAFIFSLVYLVSAGTFATKPLYLEPSLVWTIVSRLLAPFATGLLSALHALHSNGNIDSQESA